jgi:hypothetical protein
MATFRGSGGTSLRARGDQAERGGFSFGRAGIGMSKLGQKQLLSRLRRLFSERNAGFHSIRALVVGHRLTTREVWSPALGSKTQMLVRLLVSAWHAAKRKTAPTFAD